MKTEGTKPRSTSAAIVLCIVAWFVFTVSLARSGSPLLGLISSYMSYIASGCIIFYIAMHKYLFKNTITNPYFHAALFPAASLVSGIVVFFYSMIAAGSHPIRDTEIPTILFFGAGAAGTLLAFLFAKLLAPTKGSSPESNPNRASTNES